MEEMFLDQFAALQEGGKTGMIAPHAPRTTQETADLERVVGRELAGGSVAGEWRSPYDGTRYHRGDVICATGRVVGRVKRFAAAPDRAEAQAVVVVWEELARRVGSGTYRVGESVLAIPWAELRRACIYSRVGPQRTVIW